MKSVLEMDDLSDFLLQATMANKDFQSEREQFLNIDNVAQEYVPTGQATAAIIHGDAASARPEANFAFKELSVPRRPKWTPGVTTPEELEAMENESFLEWRRGVALREEQIAARAFASHGGGAAGAPAHNAPRLRSTPQLPGRPVSRIQSPPQILLSAQRLLT